MQTALIDLAAILILFAGLATGIRLREHARSVAPVARHIPGLPSRQHPKPAVNPIHWHAVAGLSIIAVVGLAVWNVSALATLLVALCLAAVLAGLALPIHAYARSCARTNVAINTYAPRIAVAYAGTEVEHVGMWAPYVGQAGRPWCVVAATPELLDRLAATYEVPMVAGALPVTIRVALYPDGTADNSSFLASEGPKHVFLGHGDSDKPSDPEQRLLDYDIVAVAGRAAIDRFAARDVDVPPGRIRIIGRPQTEGVRHADAAMSKIESPTVLFAPTWRHPDDSANLSSLVVGDRIVKALLARGVTVLFRRHFAGLDHADTEEIRTIDELLEQDAEQSGRAHLWGEAASSGLPLVEAFNESDAMICDVSGIVVDYMQSEKPFAMYSSQIGSGPDLATEFRSAHPSAESAYVLDKDLLNLETILNLMLGPDPLSPTRTARAGYYLGGEDRRDPAQPFIDLVRQLSG